MSKLSIDERVAKIKERTQRLKGEQQHLEGIIRSIDRKQQTRRKIWVGGWLLNEIAKDEALRQRLVAHLRSAKFRQGERDLFDDLLNG